MQTSIYLTNLGKYNEGWLVGERLNLPCTDDEISACLKRIGIGSKDCFGQPYEEFFISDYESEIFDIEEYSNPFEINRQCQILEELDDNQKLVVKAYLNGLSSDFEEAVNHCDDAIVWYGCNSMTELAERLIDEQGLLNSMPEDLRDYFDFEAYGRDLDYSGTFIQIDEGIVEIFN